MMHYECEIVVDGVLHKRFNHAFDIGIHSKLCSEIGKYINNRNENVTVIIRRVEWEKLKGEYR